MNPDLSESIPSVSKISSQSYPSSIRSSESGIQNSDVIEILVTGPKKIRFKALANKPFERLMRCYANRIETPVENMKFFAEVFFDDDDDDDTLKMKIEMNETPLAIGYNKRTRKMQLSVVISDKNPYVIVHISTFGGNLSVYRYEIDYNMKFYELKHRFLRDTFPQENLRLELHGPNDKILSDLSSPREEKWNSFSSYSLKAFLSFDNPRPYFDTLSERLQDTIEMAFGTSNLQSSSPFAAADINTNYIDATGKRPRESDEFDGWPNVGRQTLARTNSNDFRVQDDRRSSSGSVSSAGSKTFFLDLTDSPENSFIDINSNFGFTAANQIPRDREGLPNYHHQGHSKIVPHAHTSAWLSRQSSNEQNAQKSLKKLIENFDHVDIPPEEWIDTPNQMCIELKDYQKQGVTWMIRMEKGNHHGGILSDEMGLGKTVQSIASILLNTPENISNRDSLAHEYMEQLAVRSSPRNLYIGPLNKMATLIILPVGLIEQWKSELENLIKPHFALNILVYHSDFLNSSAKQVYIDTPALLGTFDVVLTSYGHISGQFGFDKNNMTQYYSSKFVLDLENPRVGPLFKYKWHRIILDEAHTIKNRYSQGSIAVSHLMGSYRWCLTGTPIQNTSDDLFSLFRFLKMEPYSTWNRFNSDLSVNPTRESDKRTIAFTRGKRIKRLQAVLACCLLRRTKKTKLPGANEPILRLSDREYIESRPEFSPEERLLYNQFEKRNLEIFERLLPDLNQNYTSILVMITRMRQLCLHYSLVTNGVEILQKLMVEKDSIEKLKDRLSTSVKNRIKPIVLGQEELPLCTICISMVTTPVTTLCGHIYCAPCITMLINNSTSGAPRCPVCRELVKQEELIPLKSFENDYGMSSENDIDECVEQMTPKESYSSAKIEELIRILRESRESHPTEKTIIFCSFVRVFDLIQPRLLQENFNYVRLDGSMKVSERSAAVRALSEDNEVNVMLISLRCGSVGLNLTAANRVILLDLWWNPALENQAIDRVHRIGQLAKKVYVTKITIPGTIEDRIRKLQFAKQDLADSALGEGEDTARASRLTKNELIYLFRGEGPPPLPRHS